MKKILIFLLLFSGIISSQAQQKEVISDTADGECLVLAMQDKHAEAEKGFRALAAQRVRLQGAEHIQTLQTRTFLAIEMEAQGKHSDAEKEHRAVLAVQERVMGENSADVFQSCLHLAECLAAQKKPKDALEFAKRAEIGLKATLGKDWPDGKKAEELCKRLQAELKK